jgi:uncharacterized damage-inducible protein DinB
MESPSSKDVAFSDLERELALTRTVLERLPAEQYGWRPHEKSMSLGQLASHVAELPDWIRGALDSDGLDLASPGRPIEEPLNRTEVLNRFDRHVAAVREAVVRFDMATYGATWTVRNGAQVIAERPRPTVYRIWCLNHMIHHRAQLCVYLRLLNVPIPTIYFNTAEDPEWLFP